MSVIGSNSILAGASGQGGYFLEDSLRFRSSATAYLSRTPASASNRKTWTWSAWVKRGNLSANQTLFTAGNGTYDSRTEIVLDANDYLYMVSDHRSTGGTWYGFNTLARFRDPSAWYHIVVIWDTTQSTDTNRLKGYINNIQYTFNVQNVWMPQNFDGYVNSTSNHYIGKTNHNGVTHWLDGYLTEINLIDGQALDPSYFGETDVVTGVWKPKKYTGTYGTNGFYLPMTPTSQAEGFNTVIWPSTNGVSGYITNVGFSPDFIWGKSRDNVQSHHLVDSIRGGDKVLFSNLTNAEATNAGAIISFDSDGFSYGTSSAFTNGSMVAWCWDAGSGSPASNTDGSITSTVKANQAKGFSIVSYTGTGSNATVGHGLGTSPSMIIVKNRSSASNWYVGHDGVDATSPWNYRMILQDTDARANDGAAWNDTAPTSSVFSIGTSGATNGSGNAMIAYCFSEVAGYSKIGSYTGNGSSTGPVITTGFRPAFVMFKVTSTTASWVINDSIRNPYNTADKYLIPNNSNAEGTLATVDFTSNGFQLRTADSSWNQSGQTYIYMAFADTRDTAFNNDASGNKNNWTPNNINSNASGQSTYDLMTDVPTLTDADAGNFCTLNPVNTYGSPTVSDGNLTATGGASQGSFSGTIGANAGKYYAEFTPTNVTNSVHFGVFALGGNSNGANVGPGQDSRCIYREDGNVYGSTLLTTYATYNTSNVIGVAVNLDASPPTVSFYKDNSLQGTINLSTSYSEWTFAVLTNGSGGAGVINFGQRPFTYTPPSGYKALNTYNLPTPTIKDGEDYFNPLLYTGTGSQPRSITGVGFQPDFLWIKRRDAAGGQNLYDAVRGSNLRLESHTTGAEVNTGDITSFDSDGFTVNQVGVNNSGATYVAWNWKANGSGVSNTDGSITSTVSANTSSGFSVVTYTGTGSAATIGHGLGIAPSMLIVKRRSDASTWAVYHASLGAGKKLELNGTSGAITNAQFFTSTPTSSVFSLGTEYDVNGSGGTFVSYCFASIEGYSAFGSYTANNSGDGPFIYTGFRPAFLMTKRSNTTGSWIIWDSTREPNNYLRLALNPNLSNAEYDYGATQAWDFLSNGVKTRTNSIISNSGSDTYIYAAFAENPFKYSLAR